MNRQMFLGSVGALVLSMTGMVAPQVSFAVPVPTITSRDTTISGTTTNLATMPSGTSTSLTGEYKLEEHFNPFPDVEYAGEDYIASGKTSGNLNIKSATSSLVSNGYWPGGFGVPPNDIVLPIESTLESDTEVTFTLSSPAEVVIQVEFDLFTDIQFEFNDPPASGGGYAVTYLAEAEVFGRTVRRSQGSVLLESTVQFQEAPDKQLSSNHIISWSQSLAAGTHSMSTLSRSFVESDSVTDDGWALRSSGAAEVSLQFFDFGDLDHDGDVDGDDPGTPPVAEIDGDFNADGVVDDKDIDLLHANLGGDPAVYDLDFDSDVDQTDFDILIADILGTFEGDVNLDQFVGIDDLNVVLGNWNQSLSGWASGDLDYDDFVGIGDMNIVLGNWGLGTPPLAGATIPEPASLALLGLGGVAMLRRRK